MCQGHTRWVLLLDLEKLAFRKFIDEIMGAGLVITLPYVYNHQALNLIETVLPVTTDWATLAPCIR